jgi:hypothetical protein
VNPGPFGWKGLFFPNGPWCELPSGLLGVIANMVTDPIVALTDAQKRQGAAVLDHVHRALFQIGAVTGILAVACVLAFAAGWRQWSERHGAPTSAARLVGLGLVASAGAMIIGYGLKGSLAIYLPGGINAHTYPNQGLYTLFMMNDSLPYLAWWGVIVAAGGVVWMAFRERLVVRWVGAISVLAVLAAFAWLVLTGLADFAGIVGPVASASRPVPPRRWHTWTRAHAG